MTTQKRVLYAAVVRELSDRIADLKRVMNQMDKFRLDTTQAEELLAKMEGAKDEYQAILAEE